MVALSPIVARFFRKFKRGSSIFPFCTEKSDQKRNFSTRSVFFVELLERRFGGLLVLFVFFDILRPFDQAIGGVPAIVCINHFASDTEAETAWLSKWCEDNGYDYAYCSAFADGGKGAEALARGVMKILETKKSNYHPLYDVNLPIKEKIEIIAKEIYGAGQVVYTEEADKQIADFTALGFDKTPICIAKTPQSLTDDAKVLGAPRGFTVTVKEVRLSAGANFIVPLTGAIMTMPGLPKVPAAVKMEDVPYDQKLDH